MALTIYPPATANDHEGQYGRSAQAILALDLALLQAADAG
jgi:hypothetical protein